MGSQLINTRRDKGFTPRHRNRAAFTLVELLVVAGIIAILIAILMPAVSLARQHANRVTCQARLHDLGASFQMYLAESKNKLPAVNTMPSVRPPLNSAPPITEILAPYGQKIREAWRCPMDHTINVDPGAPSGYLTYFDREGSSYQYNPWLASNYSGRQLQDARLARTNADNLLPVISDYDTFHGKPGTNGAMNFLFADMHVGDLGN